MADHVTIYPTDWRFKPTQAQVEAVVQFLTKESVLGEPDIKNGRKTWRSGPGLEKLGIHNYSDELCMTVDATDKLGVHAGEGFAAECPGCQTAVPNWGDLMDSFHETNVEPDCACPNCGKLTPLTKLSYPYGCAITHFAIDMFDAGLLPEKKPAIFKELEKLLGTELTMTMYHM